MKSLRGRGRSGFTIIELVVAVGIMSFLFSFMAYLIFVTSRNAILIHQKVIAQTKAAAAAERVVQTLRNSCFFQPVGSDDPSSSGTIIRRVRFGWPGPAGNPDSPQWGQIRFVDTANSGRVEIFMNDADLTQPPDFEYGSIDDFAVQFETSTRVTVRVSYYYRAFGLWNFVDSNGDGIPDNSMSGQFITDVIAKNHHVGQGVANYGETTTTIARL